LALADELLVVEGKADEVNELLRPACRSGGTNDEVVGDRVEGFTDVEAEDDELLDERSRI
jgi:hypothetical protein